MAIISTKNQIILVYTTMNSVSVFAYRSCRTQTEDHSQRTTTYIWVIPSPLFPSSEVASMLRRRAVLGHGVWPFGRLSCPAGNSAVARLSDEQRHNETLHTLFWLGVVVLASWTLLVGPSPRGKCLSVRQTHPRWEGGFLGGEGEKMSYKKCHGEWILARGCNRDLQK